MSARTCLLCGKPLMRIWVGAGEDFCSREHRNQYRLRAGMDRLQEANKVATLMRRRESPKPITSHQPSSGGEIPYTDPQPLPFPIPEHPAALPTSKWKAVVRKPRPRGPASIQRASKRPELARDFPMQKMVTSQMRMGNSARYI